MKRVPPSPWTINVRPGRLVCCRDGHFRSRFRLGAKEMSYLHEKTLAVVLEHGRRFVTEVLADAHPRNDGKQTPMRGHPFSWPSTPRPPVAAAAWPSGTAFLKASP